MLLIVVLKAVGRGQMANLSPGLRLLIHLPYQITLRKIVSSSHHLIRGMISLVRKSGVMFVNEIKVCRSSTVNVDIFAQLNFRASSPLRQIRAVKFSRICCLFLFVLLQL